jgi:hypothetical protein
MVKVKKKSYRTRRELNPQEWSDDCNHASLHYHQFAAWLNRVGKYHYDRTSSEVKTFFREIKNSC